MIREKLPDRRPSYTGNLYVNLDGQDHKILITVGFRENKPAEVFSSSFKVGSSLNAIISDACILLSRLYQHGDSPKDVASCLGDPPSLVGQIAQWVIKISTEEEPNA